jgi:hypothetical protein
LLLLESVDTPLVRLFWLHAIPIIIWLSFSL